MTFNMNVMVFFGCHVAFEVQNTRSLFFILTTCSYEQKSHIQKDNASSKGIYFNIKVNLNQNHIHVEPCAFFFFFKSLPQKHMTNWSLHINTVSSRSPHFRWKYMLRITKTGRHIVEHVKCCKRPRTVHSSCNLFIHHKATCICHCGCIYRSFIVPPLLFFLDNFGCITKL